MKNNKETGKLRVMCMRVRRWVAVFCGVGEKWGCEGLNRGGFNCSANTQDNFPLSPKMLQRILRVLIRLLCLVGQGYVRE